MLLWPLIMLLSIVLIVKIPSSKKNAMEMESTVQSIISKLKWAGNRSFLRTLDNHAYTTSQWKSKTMESCFGNTLKELMACAVITSMKIAHERLIKILVWTGTKQTNALMKLLEEIRTNESKAHLSTHSLIRKEYTGRITEQTFTHQLL